MKRYWNLLLTMLKIGLFTFGGGYAMIALLENEFVSKKNWIPRDEFLDMVAIAESTPGPIAINAATYVGYKTLGVWGSVVATTAVCIPSFVIIYLISLFFDAFLAVEWIANAFLGIRICVVYLIASAGLRLWKGMEKSPLSIGILIVVVVAMILSSIFAVTFSTVYYILICGAVGVFAYLLGHLRGKEKK